MHFRQALGRWCLRLPHCLLLLLMIVSDASAYRVGDVVDTDVLIDAVQSDALRIQMPMFGVDWTSRVRFEVPDSARTVSLQFEDGLWTTHVYAMKSEGQFLERFQVQFTYSKSVL